MLRLAVAGVFSLLLAACSTAPSAEQRAAEKAAEPIELQPAGGTGEQVCGWGDDGRWKCRKGTPKKSNPKFNTKFKKGPPPPEKESKLPRGDQPFDDSPIDD